jgi:fucose permease
LSAAAYLAMFVFGIAMALIGAILPVLSERLRFDLAQVGGLFFVMNLCMLLCNLGLGPLMDRFGLKPPLVLGALLVAVALAGIAAAAEFRHLTFGVALLGIGGGALNAAANVLVADLHDDPRRKGAALNLLGMFYGFGALFIPFVIGLLLSALGLAGILSLAALVCVATAVFDLTLAFPSPKHAQSLPLREAGRLVRTPAVLVMGALLFFQSGNEFILGGFGSTYLTREVGLDIAAASYTLAAYWAALMLARALLSRLLPHVSENRLVLACAGASAVTVAVLVSASHPAVAVAAFVLTSAALAGVFPTVLGIVGGRFPTHSGTVFGLLFAMALTGGMTLPWLSGRMAASFGLRTAFGLVAAQFVATALLQAAAGGTLRRGAARGLGPVESRPCS